MIFPKIPGFQIVIEIPLRTHRSAVFVKTSFLPESSNFQVVTENMEAISLNFNRVIQTTADQISPSFLCEKHLQRVKL